MNRALLLFRIPNKSFECDYALIFERVSMWFDLGLFFACFGLFATSLTSFTDLNLPKFNFFLFYVFRQQNTNFTIKMSLKLDQSTIQSDLTLIREKLSQSPRNSQTSSFSSENLNQIQNAVHTYENLKTQIDATEKTLQKAQELVTSSTTDFQQ